GKLWRAPTDLSVLGPPDRIIECADVGAAAQLTAGMTKIIEESLGCGLDLLQPSDTPIDFLPHTSLVLGGVPEGERPKQLVPVQLGDAFVDAHDCTASSSAR